MIYPENPKDSLPIDEIVVEEYIQSIAIPDNLRQLWQTEKNERLGLIDGIREQLNFIHSTYGSDDETQQSFHHDSNNEHNLSVFISKYDNPYAGREHHVIINNESLMLDLREKLEYTEFCIAEKSSAFDVAQAVVETETSEDNWSAKRLGKAALLLPDGDTNYLYLLRGDKSEMLAPPTHWSPHPLEVIAARRTLSVVHGALALIMNGQHIVEGMYGDLAA